MATFQPSDAARQRLELSSSDMSETLCGHQVKCVGNDTSAVVVPPGNFIPLSVDEILEACLDAFPNAEQKQNFQRFYALMEAIVHFEFHDLCKAIIYNYRLFGNTVESVRMRSLLTDADLQKREQDFIKQFCGLMCMANFNLLSDKEYKIAKAEDFLFTLPVDMDWKCLDDKLLTKFLDNHPELATHVPSDFTNRILIFHRGIEEAVVKDKFISEKVEMIVDKVVFSPFRFVWSLVGGKKKAPEINEESPSEDLGVSHEHTRVIHRKTLDRMLPSVFSLLTKIISKIEIQEPAFSNVVVVYRHSLAGESKINKNGSNDEKQQRARAIYIKMFRHIPMADMEVTFPFKSLSFKPSSVVSLAVTCVLSILAVYNALQKGKKGGSQTFALTVIILLIVRCVQLYKSMQAAKKAMEDDITRTLFSKTQDNDEGVVYYLLTSTEQQELKEILLAYAFLLAAGGAEHSVEIETLDKSIEKALHDKYKIGCDFEIDDAVRKLINHKLAWKDNDGKLRVHPFKEALSVLDNKWDNYFNY